MSGITRIPPPIYLVCALLMMLALDHYAPILTWDSVVTTAGGTAAIVIGVSITAWGAGAFSRAGTPIRPFQPSTVLVTHGLFRLSRNPMYLGMFVVLAGIGLVLGSLSPLFVIPPFFLLIRNAFVRREEAFLGERFGQAYWVYSRRVPRWF
ncbi:MAG: methyltransferase family protein [Gammaproteobacteria bacterium]